MKNKTLQPISSRPLRIVCKALCYLIGLLLISVGINFSKLSALGISPVSSVPRVLELKWGFTLGTTTMIVYAVLVVLQIVVLRRRFRPLNLLGFVLAWAFGFMVDFTGTNPAAFGHLMAGMPAPGNYVMRLVFLLVSILLIGLGVTLYLIPHWVPMPAEGLAAALSEATSKTFGDCKTAVDVSLITVALLLQLIFLGGFSSFTGTSFAVREGTILSAVCVGQCVKLLNRLFGNSLKTLFGTAPASEKTENSPQNT